jgi:WG containing repeat
VVNTLIMLKRLLMPGFFGLLLNSLQAQETISGTYNRAKKIFVADDDEYWIDYFTNGIARIAKDGYMGLMDSTGKIICPVQYDIIYPLEKDAIRMGINGRLGLLNYAGKITAEAQFRELWPFAEGVARFREYNGHLQGFISSSGTIIAKAEYNNVSSFRGGMGRYQRNEQYGIISKQGREIPLFTKKDFTGKFERYNPYPIGEGDEQYDRYDYPASIRLLEFSCGLAPVPGKSNDKQRFGFTDTSGTMAIPVQYDSVSNFRKGFAAVKKDRYWGVINTKGELIIPHQYDVVRLTDTCFFIIAQKNKWGVADTANGIKIPLQYTFIKYLFGDVFGFFSEEKVDEKSKRRGFDTDRRDWGLKGKWGAINSNGQVVMPPVYDGVERINKNLAKAITIISRYSLSTGLPRYNETTRYAVFDASGPADNSTYWSRNTRIGLTYDTRDIFDVYDYRQRDISDAAYIPLQEQQKNGQVKAVVLDAKGKKITETGYYQIHEFSMDKATVSVLANPSPEKIAPAKPMNTFAPANSNNSNNAAAPFLWYPFEPKVKAGMMNSKGEVIIPPVFEQVGADVYYKYLSTAWVKDFIPVKRGQKWGVRDERNNIVVSVKYDEITVGHCGAVVSKNDKYGFIDFKGNVIIPLEYEKLVLDYSGLLFGETGNKDYIVDKKGNRTNL